MTADSGKWLLLITNPANGAVGVVGTSDGEPFDSHGAADLVADLYRSQHIASKIEPTEIVPGHFWFEASHV